MKTSISVDKAGRVVLPQHVRRQFHLLAGDRLDVETCLARQTIVSASLALLSGSSRMERLPSSSGASVTAHDGVLTDFLDGIGSVRSQISTLLLFGSRARGDHRTHSDYDVLVVVSRKSPALLDVLYDSVLQVLLDHGRLVSLKVFEEQQFARLQRLGTPFSRRIAMEGQPLG